LKKIIRNLLLVACATSCAAWADYSEHPDAVKFSQTMVERHQFESADVERWLQDAVRVDSIIAAMQRPAEKVKPWHQYKKHFINDLRIARGVEFWSANRANLERAEREFGVDPAIIVSIIGVETNYGRNVGSFRVIDALSTLAFDYYTEIEQRESRRLFFTAQLENLLLLARDQQQNPLTLKGSYAGAMGWGQFMPSSYRNYAVDFDGDKFADIWNNPIDAIGSVANYFAEHGWQPGQAVALRAVEETPLDNSDNGSSQTSHQVATGDTLFAIASKYGVTMAELQRQNKLQNPNQIFVGQRLKINTHFTVNKLGRPTLTLDELRRRGLTPLEPTDGSRRALPLLLDGGSGDEYWLGLHNFYVISRYNPRVKYAMAVYQLSELIRSQHCGPENPC
jgi:membrane-bound lytic murein transglycosylase B